MFSVSLLLLVTIDNRTRAYSNQWTAQIRGGPDVAQRVAMEHGFHYRHQVFFKYLNCFFKFMTRCDCNYSERSILMEITFYLFFWELY